MISKNQRKKESVKKSSIKKTVIRESKGYRISERAIQLLLIQAERMKR